MSSVSRDETGRNGGKGGNKGLIIGIIVAVAVILALVIVIIILIKSRKDTEEPAQAVAGANVAAPVEENENIEKRSVVVTKENVDQIIEQMEETEFIEPGYFEASMTNTWHFDNGEAVSEDAYVANVVNNTHDVYFDLVLAENEEQVIYASPVIPRGGELDQISLDTPLEAGSYDCVVIYHLIDENQNTISTLRVGVTVVIGG